MLQQFMATPVITQRVNASSKVADGLNRKFPQLRSASET